MKHLSFRCRLFAVMLAAGLLSSCEDFVPRGDPVVDIRPSWNNAAAAGAESLHDWWRGFDSVQLDSLVDKALAGNFKMQAAHQRLMAARALRGAGESNFRPAAVASTASERNPQATAQYFLVGIDASWELPLFGRAVNAGRLLQAQVDDALSDEAAVRAALTADVVRAYLESRFAQRELGVVEELANVADDRRQRQATRIRLGLDDALTSTADLQQAPQARAESGSLQRIRKRGLESLAALLGSTAIDESWVGNEGELRVPAVPATLPADLLRRRPDIRHAEAAVERAAAQLGIARADRYPSVSIAGALTASIPVAGHVRSSTNSIVSAGPLITLPLFDWGLRKAQAEAHGAALRAAVLDYRQVVLDAVAEVEAALLQVEEAMEQSALQAAAMDSAEQAERRAQAQRQLGLQRQVTALDLKREALLARQSLVHAERDQSLALVHLMLALGAG
ncbi:MAG: efflux transporter outer membrane subunit [Steroidobacteraceae bacterium]